MNPMCRPGSLLAFVFKTQPGVSAVCLGLAAVLAGCRSAGSAGSTLAPGVLAAGARHGVSPGDLAQGREIFATECTACHRMQPVGRFSAEEWSGIVADMSPRAKLTGRQRAQLLAYVTAARMAAGP